MIDIQAFLQQYQKNNRMDGGQTIFFNHELEAIESKTYEILQAPLKALELFPMTANSNYLDKTITYRMYDKTGRAKIVSNGASDYPSIGMTGSEFTNPIRVIGTSYGYSVMDLERALRYQKPLDAFTISANVEAHRQLWNEIAFYGDSEYKLPGFLTNANIPKITAATVGGETAWTEKTSDEILDDMNTLVSLIVDNTNQTQLPDTLVLPVPEMEIIGNRPRSSNSDMTIKKFFLENNEYIKNIVAANELKAANLALNGINTYTGDVMFAYKRDPDVIGLELPLTFRMSDFQMKGTEMVRFCDSVISGTIIRYPLAIAIMDGIGGLA